LVVKNRRKNNFRGVGWEQLGKVGQRQKKKNGEENQFKRAYGQRGGNHPGPTVCTEVLSKRTRGKGAKKGKRDREGHIHDQPLRRTTLLKSKCKKKGGGKSSPTTVGKKKRQRGPQGTRGGGKNILSKTTSSPTGKKKKKVLRRGGRARNVAGEAN